MANLLINTTVGGNAVITTSNIGTYALTSIPATIGPTNINIGNAIYFGGGNNYLNWSGSRINSNVGIQSAVDMVAPIFYDSDNGAYYGDFASTSVMNAIRFGTSTNNGTLNGAGDWGMRLTTNHGWIQFGPANSSHAHIYTDRPNFYFNADLLVNGNTVLTAASYNSYSPTLTGSGASGTWGINVTGTAARATRANGNFYIDDNYGNTIVGVYASTRYQGVFAMGDSYKLPADGTSTGNLYGLAWSHPNAGGVASNLNDHGLLVINNGVFAAAISSSIRAAADMRAPIFYDSQNAAYYLDPNSTSNLNIVNLSTLNSNTLNTSDVNARYFSQSTNGVPSNNLGSPTVTEMALFDEQFNNKTAFYNPASLSFWTSSDGTNYTEYTGFDTTIKKRFLGGDSDSGVYIPNLTNRFRIEVENSAGYVFLNQLYIYWSSNSHSTKVHIWVRRCDNNQWYQWTDSNVQVSSWPGHLYLPFGGIPFYPGYLDSTGHYNRIRIEFIPTWAGGTYSYTGINLMRMQIWGGYPAGKRNIYSTDENQNVSFPAIISATTFSGALSGNATTASALTSMNISQFTNNSGYITGYTETDTLNSITNRGNTTSNSVRFGSYLDISPTTSAFRFYDGTTFRGGFGLDSWGHYGSDANLVLYVNGDNTLFFSTSGTKRASLSSSAFNSLVALQQSGNQVLHAANYTSYSPTLTGTGASGTWGISISGSAGSATALSTVTNYSAYNSANALLATPSGHNMSAAFINFTGGNSIAPFSMYRTSGDWPAPYGIGWGTGGESSGIFQRFSVNGSSLGKMTSYINNDGLGSFVWVTGTWEATTYQGAGSNHYANEIMTLSNGGNLYVAGTITGSNLSGTNTGDQTNISGNAATATNVAWTGVTSRPTALSQFSNDLGNYGGWITSSGSISGSAGSVSGLTLTSSANGINPDSVTQNQIGYNTSVSLFGQSDGGLYSSAYSSSWIHQIYGDFRTGQIAIRGKNSGSWQSWRTVLDSSNYTSYAPGLTGSGASGTWGINVTGSAGSVAWTNVSSRPTNLSQFTNDLGNYGGWQSASTAITTSNIGSQSVSYASTAGSAPANGGNSSTVGGYAVSGSVGANTVVIRDSNGYIYAHYINSNVSESENPTINSFYTSNGDGWLRKSSVAHVKSQLGLGSMAYESSGTYQTVSGAINTGNIGSQSVSYATTSQQLTKFGDIYGQDWNSYYINGKMIVSSVYGGSGPNFPTGAYNYGAMLSYGVTGSDFFQVYFPENGALQGGAFRKLHYRTGWNGSWSAWKSVVDQEGQVCTIAGSNQTGIEIHSNVGYNQDPLTYFLMRGQADTSWKALKVRLTGDAGGQDIEFRRIAENGTDSRMWYVPRGANTVNFDYPIVQPSDSRLKDNITPISTPVDKIKSLRGVEFDWNSGEQVGTHDVGLIAQDVEAVLPEAVTTQEDGYKNLAYIKVIPLLVEAMKEQQTMIEALRAEIELLKNK